MVALLSELQTNGFQRILFTAGWWLAVAAYYDNLYIVIESSRKKAKRSLLSSN